MTERPILFGGPMVRALLDGRKTQTRRIVKWPQGTGACDPEWCCESRWKFDDGGWFCRTCGAGVHPAGKPMGAEYMRCPYGVPSDTLWVRETWAPVRACTHNDPGTGALAAGGFYRADDSTVDGEIDRWRPAIHMPRSASRLTLAVTEVRIERLQDISEADAEAEGVQIPALVPILGAFWSSRDGYARLWEHINGNGSWAANPWVWAVTFEVQARP